MTDTLLSIAEAARQLNCSTKTVRRLLNNGKIRFIPLTGSAKGDKIALSDLLDFIERNKRINRCQSESAETRGKYPSPSAGGELEKRLGAARQNRTPIR